MKIKTNILQYEEYDTINELSEQEQILVQKAIEIAHKSYSIYSNFPVGAAALMDDGQIFCGNNQENLSYPAGNCAERTLLNYVHANFPDKKFKTIAITATNSTSTQPVTPCGICRQVLCEMETVQNEPLRVLLHKIDGPTLAFQTTKDLLPFAFEEANLGK